MKPLVLFVLGLLLIGLLMVLFREPVLNAIGNYLIIRDPRQPVDVIHVIAGDDQRENYAIQLYKEGYAKYLFFTGGWCDTLQAYHGERGRELAVAAGIPSDRIAIDDTRVISTYQEIEALKRWIDVQDTPIRSVMVVSDPYHMRRAHWAYRQLLGKDVILVMAPIPMEQTTYQQRWWEDRLTRARVKDEYIKFIYYLARYKYSWGPVKAWLAAMDTE